LLAAEVEELFGVDAGAIEASSGRCATHAAALHVCLAVTTCLAVAAARAHVLCKRGWRAWQRFTAPRAL
jgi:hypothetical protein